MGVRRYGKVSFGSAAPQYTAPARAERNGIKLLQRPFLAHFSDLPLYFRMATTPQSCEIGSSVAEPDLPKCGSARHRQWRE